MVSCGVVPPSALVVPVVTGTGVYVPPPPTDQATATKGLTWEESPADLFRPIQLAVDQCCGTRPITSLGCTRECVNAAADQNRADQCNDMCTWGRAASGVCYDNCLARYALRDYIPSYIEVSSE